MDLNLLGFSKFFKDQHIIQTKKRLIPARVISQHRDYYFVSGEFGECLAETTGKMMHKKKTLSQFPAVGDWVWVKYFKSDNKAIIQKIFERKTKFSRKVVGTLADEQIIATNIDIVFFVTTADRDFNIKRIQRYIVAANKSGAKPVILINKIDLCRNLNKVKEIINIEFSEYECVFLSALTGENISDLNKYLDIGVTVAFIGSSGVGKSSLINQVIGFDRQRINRISEDNFKGQHTTTYRELIIFDKGMLIDTPGMREIQMWADEKDLQESFNDIIKLSENCKFHDCNHYKEPGCKVKEALENGELDFGRFLNYIKIRMELQEIKLRKNDKLNYYERDRLKELKEQYSYLFSLLEDKKK